MMIKKKIKSRSLGKDVMSSSNFNNSELSLKCLNYYMNNECEDLYNSYLFKYLMMMSKFYNVYLTRVVNSCAWSGRTSWVLRKFKLSSMFLKEYASRGFFCGVRKVQ